MPEKETIERAREDASEGSHGARNTKQAIAIGLSKARKAGVELGPNPSGKTTKPPAAGDKAD